MLLGGRFLGSGGTTVFNSYLNTTDEHLVVDCTLEGTIPGVKGTGTLPIIEFQVKEGEACDLNLYDTQLLNSNETAIILTVRNGHFSAWRGHSLRRTEFGSRRKGLKFIQE
jgi:hypothetical protein